MSLKRKVIIMIVVYLGIVAYILVSKNINNIKTAEQYKSPIDINIEEVSQIKIYISEYGDNEVYYKLYISDKDKLNELILKMNSIKAESAEIEPRNADICIYVYVYGYDDMEYFEIRFVGTEYFSVAEGGIGNMYKMSEEYGETLIDYLKELCLSDENLLVKYGFEDSWQLYRQGE